MAKDVLLTGERQRIKDQKSTSVKANSLLMMLREKSAAEFDSFLKTLSETGQQSVADVVHQALYTIAQTGQNPLRISDGNSAYSI